MSETPLNLPGFGLPEGLYDQLLDAALCTQLRSLTIPGLAPLVRDIDPGESHSVLAQYLERLILRGLANHRGKDQDKQLALAQRIIDILQKELHIDHAHPTLTSPLQRLLARHLPQGPAVHWAVPL